MIRGFFNSFVFSSIADDLTEKANVFLKRSIKEKIWLFLILKLLSLGIYFNIGGSTYTLLYFCVGGIIIKSYLGIKTLKLAYYSLKYANMCNFDPFYIMRPKLPYALC